MFDRSYVEELRQENAKYRTRAKSYEEAFDGYSDEDKETLLTYVRLTGLANAGDQDAATQLAEMFGGEDDEDTDDYTAPEPVDYRAIAREEAEAALTARETARHQEEGIAAVRKAGEDLGYAFGSEDYILFVRGANEAANAGSDDPIAAGDVAVKAYHQQVLERFLALKGQQADGTIAPTPQGGAPSLSTRPWTDDMSESQRFSKVAESALERFQRQNG
jgi:hypothetical protein